MELSDLVAAVLGALLIGWVAIVLWATVRQLDSEARAFVDRNPPR